MRYPFEPSIIRLRVTPDPKSDSPPPIPGGRPRGSRRPHTDAKAAEVRRLIEQTELTYSQISARTGVGRASISRWSRDGAWTRPPFAPRATDRMPTARASQKLKLRTLAERLRQLAEQMVVRLEADAGTDVDRLMQALQVLKMARLEAMGRRRRRREPADRTRTIADWLSEDEAIRTALKEMRRGGVDLEHIPQEAMDLLTAAKRPAEETDLGYSGRGRRKRRRDFE
ncbi:conserved hypothetical protein [Rhodopseudomonas palustris HaA2]|uniref:Uncharacterized protein n=1 Tax=Rhodopseudomonas palustris (strain HaA2) TaxID=316058 RepID=Q2IYE2_RHOP2|nr:hypothetical protein [Rhodopseudomonas palustris]ABD06768.1 conserved hypothetical protein [Rhodopseudomonas palustris HaA2]